MDAETRRNIERIDRDLIVLREDASDKHCPLDGCRYMEDKSRKIGGMANWISSLGLIAYLGFELIRSLR